MAEKKSDENEKLIASNRKARHDYTILDVVEAGIVLLGSEVKSVRSGQVQLADAYAHVIGSEMWLDGMHIAPYSFAGWSRRSRPNASPQTSPPFGTDSSNERPYGKGTPHRGAA